MALRIKDVSGAKLLPMIILAYPVDCMFLSLIEDTVLLPVS